MVSFPYDLLVDLAEGRVPLAEAASIRARIATDARAQAELEAIEQLIALMRSDDSIDAPAHVLARAFRLVRREEAPSAAGLLRRIAAALRSDSWQAPLAAGLRTDQPTTRDLVYTAEDRDLDLQIAPSGNLWQLRGQVLGPDDPGSITLSSGQILVSVELSDLGEFTLPPLPPGSYELVLRQGDREIVIAELELGPSPR